MSEIGGKDEDDVVELTTSVTATNTVALNGATLDGKGNTITVNNVANDTTNYGINATGGTISNVKITGESYTFDGDPSSPGDETYGFRAIMVSGSLADDLYIDNVDASGATYGINISNGNGKNLYVTDSKLGDWNSFSGVNKAYFTGCTFTSDDIYYPNLRVYNAEVVLENCNFEVGNTYWNGQYGFDNLSGSTGTVKLVNCKVNGVTVTAGNLSTYFTIADTVVTVG